MGLNFALQALRRQGLKLPERPAVDFLGYHPARRADALALARQMRQNGWAVVCDYENQTLAELRSRVGQSDFAAILYLGETGDELEELTAEPGDSTATAE